ncbi:MAG TPA: cyclic nucleotide-binding domain-containing protein, partial [Anaerolineae bacterium]
NAQTPVLANLSQGSLLGDADVLLGHNHTTTAEAATGVEVWALGLEDLVDVVAEDPEIGLKLSKIYRGSVVPLIRYLVERRLRTIPGLDELPDTELTTMAGRLCVCQAQVGDLLFTAGQAPTSLFIVDDGAVTVAGPEGVVDYGPGAVVAERNLLLGRAHTLTARAGAAARLWELSAVDLDRLSGLYPDLRAALSRVLQSHLDASDVDRAVTLMRATPIFQSVPEEALRSLAGKLVWLVAPNGGRICEAAAPAEAMYLVEGGSVELLSGHGESQGSVQAGAYFGEAALSDGAPYGFAAVARSNTTLWVLHHADFVEVAALYPALQAAVNEQAQKEKQEAAEHFAERHMRRLTLFANTKPEELREIAGYLKPMHFRSGQAVYERGQPGDALYLIEQGRVSVQARTSEGRGRVLAVMGPGDFVGETALLTGEPHATDATAQNEVSAWALTREDFEILLAQYPILAVNLSRVLSYRLRQSNEQASAAPVVAGAAAAAAAVPAETAAPVAAAASGAGGAAVGKATQRRAPKATAAGAAARPAAGAAPVSPVAWFTALTTGTKIRLIAIAILVIWLLGIAAPSAVLAMLGAGPAHPPQSAKSSLLESSMLVAMADSSQTLQVSAGATWTPWPTDTPIPSPTPTAT